MAKSMLDGKTLRPLVLAICDRIEDEPTIEAAEVRYETASQFLSGIAAVHAGNVPEFLTKLIALLDDAIAHREDEGHLLMDEAMMASWVGSG